VFWKKVKYNRISIALNLREPEVSKIYREYWKLRRLHNLNSLYEESGDQGIRNVLKVCRLLKKEHKTLEQLSKLLDLADENNPYGISFLEKRRKWLVGEIRELEIQIERAKDYLYALNNEIAGAKYTIAVFFFDWNSCS
jgi:hypothetical protein